MQDIRKHPIGKLGLIGMKGCEEITDKIDSYLLEWAKERHLDPDITTFKIGYDCPRFSSGEAKAVITESVRGFDIFIVCDVFNYGVTYKMYGMEVPMSPDDHYADLKRLIAAIGGKAKRITVIMPMLYESRQHKRNARESLDCAIALQELHNMGVDSIITFDAHDPRVQNAIPLSGFENVQPYYQMIKALVNNVPDIEFNKHKLMMVSPDEGGMARSIYYASVLELEMGMFYKRRDYSVVINGHNPIISHDFLGDSVDGMDVIVVDDMISSGESLIDVSRKLKERGARRIFAFITFSLFVDGLEKFDKAYEEGCFEKIFSTNMVYAKPELLAREWFVQADMSKYTALIIDTLYWNKTMADLLDPVKRIKNFLERKDKLPKHD